MAYDRSSALESQPTTWRREDDPQYQDDPEFVAFTSDLSDKLFSLTSTVSRLSGQVALLGTRRESERVRELKKVLAWPDVGVCCRPCKLTGIR
jgi:hypothetical protein